jgi:cyclopropane fatty-acyl-phospholipid synthase-like methyltransferase
MGDWDSIFKEQGKVFTKPQEDMEQVIKFLKKEKVKRVLDLGCGTGRHVVMLAKNGFDVYGTDISDKGMGLTKKWLDKSGLKANLKKSSCYEKFPFKNNFFDAVISIQVIHHNYHNKIKYCISEIERVLNTGGIIFITVTYHKNRGKATKTKLTELRTHIPLEGDEKGLPHFIYNKKILMEDFKNFKIIDIHKGLENHYSLLGKLR